MRSLLFGILLATTGSSCLLTAATVSYTGSLANDTSVLLFTTTVSTTSTVTFRTYSYAGGVNGAGKTILAGGFDPVVDLYNSAGTLTNANDDGSSSQVGADPITLQNFDSYLRTTLTPGNYTVALTEYDNFGNGPNLSNGFFESSPTFTSSFGCTNGEFCDITGANRTAQYALDITTTLASVPEPGAWSLLVAGLAIVGIVRLRETIRG